VLYCAVQVRRLARLIPHTSLPSSPAVFRGSGGCASSGANSSSGQQATPATPAPALHKLAAYHSGMLSGGTSSSLGITSGPDDSFTSNPGGPDATSSSAAGQAAGVSDILCTGSNTAAAAGSRGSSALLRAKSSNARSGLTVKWSEDVPELICPVADIGPVAAAEQQQEVATRVLDGFDRLAEDVETGQDTSIASGHAGGAFAAAATAAPAVEEDSVTQQQQLRLVRRGSTGVEAFGVVFPAFSTAAAPAAAIGAVAAPKQQQQQQHQQLGLWRSASDSPAHQKAASTKLQAARVLSSSLEQQQQQQEQQQLLRFMSLQPLSSPVNMEQLQVRLLYLCHGGETGSLNTRQPALRGSSDLAIPPPLPEGVPLVQVQSSMGAWQGFSPTFFCWPLGSCTPSLPAATGAQQLRGGAACVQLLELLSVCMQVRQTFTLGSLQFQMLHPFVLFCAAGPVAGGC
jgi:hypothetical protein